MKTPPYRLSPRPPRPDRAERAPAHSSHPSHRSYPRLLPLLALLLITAQAALAGTWTPLAHKAPGSVTLMLLLSDGTVMAKGTAGGGDGYGNIWYRLTPDSTGSYVNGTWTTLAAMHDTRLYMSSQVLTDGRVFVAGGEYGTGHRSAETYDPLANAWTYVPYANHTFSDANSEILPDGRVLIGPVESSQTGTIIYDPFSNNFNTGATAKGSYNESAWVKLPDNSILFVAKGTTSAERYIPATNTWITDATVPVQLYDTTGDECGPGMLLPNGKVIMFGSTGHTAIYTPSGSTANGSWVAGPDIPNGQGMPDAPCAMEPNGNILLAVCPVPISGSEFQSPTTFYEYNYLANSFTLVATPTGGTINSSAYIGTMLTLPDGSILYGSFNSQIYSYQGGGTPVASGVPAVTSIAQNNDGSYLLTGTLLNGISEGAAYGDDNQEATNYPIVRLTSGSTLYYARTYNWSSTGVMTGNTPETTHFVVPSNVPAGLYSLVVVANGISSSPVSFYYAGAGALAAAPAIVSQPQGQVLDSGANATFSVTAIGSGTLSYQWLLNGATPPNATGANTATLTVPVGAANLGAYSVTVSNAQGAVTSNQAILSVNTAPVITQGPDSIAILSGNTASLSVTATIAPGAGSQKFQWYQGTTGTTSTPVGSNSTSYTTAALTTATNYWVQVTNGDLSVNSATATVSITPTALPNLRFYQAPGYSSNVVVANATNVIVDSPLLRTNDTLYVNFVPWNNGTVAVSSAWNMQILVDGAVAITVTGNPTLGNNADTFVTNKNIGSLAAGTHTIQVILDSGNTVTEFDEGDNTFTKTITVYPAGTAAPAISGQPAGATIAAGQTATLSVTPGTSGTSSNTFTYQWYLGAAGDTTKPVGLNQATYTTPALSATTSYWVQVTNSANLSTSSNAATVTVNPAALPNLAFTQPSGWSAPVVVSGTNSATSDPSVLPLGQTLYVNFAVTNNGTAAVGSVWSAAVYIDNVLQGTVPFTAGLTVSGVITGSLPITPPAGGLHNLQVVLNSSGALLETLVTDDISTRTLNMPLTVTNLNDSGTGSLRTTIAGAVSGEIVSFASTLAGGTITLTSGEIVLPVNGLTIDASLLSGGITISGGTGTSRLFSVPKGSTLALNALTLQSGHGGGAKFSGSGGAIYSNGTLLLSGCTVSGNSSTFASAGGGAIDSTSADASLTAVNCVFSGNNDGGGINGGGAICADTASQLTCTNCTFANNISGNAGGAIHVVNAGPAAITGCTFNGNGGSSCATGGALCSTNSTVTVASSTLSANNCTSNGGAIDVQSSGILTLSQCTVSANTAGAAGGGISLDSGTVTVQNSIVAGNTAPTGPDINLTSGPTVLTNSGASVIGDDSTASATYPTGTPNANGDYVGVTGNLVNALLAPLGNYGGPTQTMALEPGSPALNHATVLSPAITSDQRGFPIVGLPDIGAYEAGTTSNYNAWIYENLPSSATAAQHAAGADYDGDGVTNYNEWLALTNPANPGSFLHITNTTVNGNGTGLSVTYPSVVGRHYTFQSSTDLLTWTPIAGLSVAGTGNAITTTITPPAGSTNYFVRVLAGP